MRNDFLDESEIAAIGFGSVGGKAKISRNAQFLSPDRIHIGFNSRIDSQCLFSAGTGGIVIGRNVHVSAMCTVLGRGRVEVGDFCTISVRCSIFSSNDDYSGFTMTNPTVPEEFRDAENGIVRIEAHVIIGAGCVVLPNVTIGESASIGALSLVKNNVAAFAIAGGVPTRIIGHRRKEHRDLASLYLSSG